MPTLSDHHEVLSRLNREDAAAIVALIDLKTEEDMDKVLNKLDAMQAGFHARMDSMEKSFDTRLDSMEKTVDARFDSMEKTVDARLTAMDHKIDTKINALYWFVGVSVTLAVAILRFL